ncbi:MAG: hypothetical protein ACRCSV_03370 [Chlamydiales bacterium]
MISSKIKRIQLGLAQYLAAAVYRIYTSAIPLKIGTFSYGCFYDFAIAKSSDGLPSSVEEILPAMIGKESALRREMVAKNAASLFRSEKKIHLAKEAERLGNRLIYVFQLHSFFYLSVEDFSLDLSRLYFAIKECIPRGNFSKKEIPIVRIIAYTAFSKQDLQNLLQRRRTTCAKMHHTIGEKMDLFHFQYDENVERIVWKERGASIFFRLQQFWHRFLRIHDTLLIEPYAIRKENKSYLNQIQKLPVAFSHKYLDYNENVISNCSSPFPNLYSLPLQMKDCSYEFCSYRSLQKRLVIKHKVIELFYDLLKIPYSRKQTKTNTQYFYDSILGKPIALGHISTSLLNKNIATIEYSLIHSIETIIGVLLEHFGENLPFWLHPVQVYIMYEPSQLPVIKKLLLNREITYHLQQIQKNTTNKVKEQKAFYTIFFFKNEEIRIRGQRNEEQKVTFFELDTLLRELEKKNCPEKLIIG